MDTVLQPHESHTNYVLQWMMDYNLQGMNPVNCCDPPHIRGHTTFCFQIHLSHALFRQGRLRDEYDDMEPVVEVPWRKARTRGRHPSLDSSLPSQTQDTGTVLSSYLSIPPGEKLFCVEDMAECLKLPAEVSYQFHIFGQSQPPCAGVPPVHLGAGAGRRGRGHHQPPGRDGRRHEPRPRGALGG